MIMLDGHWENPRNIHDYLSLIREHMGTEFADAMASDVDTYKYMFQEAEDKNSELKSKNEQLQGPSSIWLVHIGKEHDDEVFAFRVIATEHDTGIRINIPDFRTLYGKACEETAYCFHESIAADKQPLLIHGFMMRKEHANDLKKYGCFFETEHERLYSEDYEELIARSDGDVMIKSKFDAALLIVRFALLGLEELPCGVDIKVIPLVGDIQCLMEKLTPLPLAPGMSPKLPKGES